MSEAHGELMGVSRKLGAVSNILKYAECLEAQRITVKSRHRNIIRQVCSEQTEENGRTAWTVVPALSRNMALHAWRQLVGVEKPC